MMFNEQQFTKKAGALVRPSVNTKASILMETLRMRLATQKMPDPADPNGPHISLERFCPKPRAYSDALRLALRNVIAECKRVEDGVDQEILVKEVKRNKGEDFQVWLLDWRDTNAQGIESTTSYGSEGKIVLKDDGTLTVPYVISSKADLDAKAKHYQEYADESKIRSCINDIIQTMAHPLPVPGFKYVSEDKRQLLKETVKPIFQDLDAGSVSFTILRLADDAENFQDMKELVTESVSDIMSKMSASVAAAKNASDKVTKSVVLEWLATIDNLKANMETLGVLDVSLPADLEDLQLQVSAIKAEIEKPKKKKRSIDIDVDATPVASEG